jgi:hypothetical protein
VHASTSTSTMASSEIIAPLNTILYSSIYFSLNLSHCNDETLVFKCKKNNSFIDLLASSGATIATRSLLVIKNIVARNKNINKMSNDDKKTVLNGYFKTIINIDSCAIQFFILFFFFYFFYFI